jgi:acyl CoA:acetate/3-ketoacid CoA transferase beta subunit
MMHWHRRLSCGRLKADDAPGMAKRFADDIPQGWYVNLSIGAPLHMAM